MLQYTNIMCTYAQQQQKKIHMKEKEMKIKK